MELSIILKEVLNEIGKIKEKIAKGEMVVPKG